MGIGIHNAVGREIVGSRGGVGDAGDQGLGQGAGGVSGDRDGDLKGRILAAVAVGSVVTAEALRGALVFPSVHGEVAVEDEVVDAIGASLEVVLLDVRQDKGGEEVVCKDEGGRCRVVCPIRF